MNIKDYEEALKIAIKNLKIKYGVSGINNKYLLAEDIDGDLRIAAVGIVDKILWEENIVNPNNFIKVKDLQ